MASPVAKSTVTDTSSPFATPAVSSPKSMTDHPEVGHVVSGGLEQHVPLVDRRVGGGLPGLDGEHPEVEVGERLDPTLITSVVMASRARVGEAPSVRIHRAGDPGAVGRGEARLGQAPVRTWRGVDEICGHPAHHLDERAPAASAASPAVGVSTTLPAAAWNPVGTVVPSTRWSRRSPFSHLQAR